MYASLSYYEKWAAAITSILVSTGTITRAEIEDGDLSAIV